MHCQLPRKQSPGSSALFEGRACARRWASETQSIIQSFGADDCQKESESRSVTPRVCVLYVATNAPEQKPEGTG